MHVWKVMSLCGSAFPEVLKTTTEFRAAKSNDGIRAVKGPVHSGAFEARADGHLAPGLHDARGSAQTLSVELRVAHAFAVGLKIMEAAAGLFTKEDTWRRIAVSSARNFPVSSSCFRRSAHCAARGAVGP